MRTKSYSCPNGCKLPPRRKVLQQIDKHSFGYGYQDFTYCPICGGLMPYSLKKIKNFFELYNIHSKLEKAERLIYKSEFESAAREAFIVVETELRNRSGLDLYGFDLAAKALKYEYDKQNETVSKYPLIAINELKTDSDRNEQDGIRYMLMGFFHGIRNLYLHNHIGSGVSNALNVVLDASFFLKLLDGHSLSKKGRWIRTSIDYREILAHTPRLIDRVKLNLALKKKRK